jgi:hypothetical protein
MKYGSRMVSDTEEPDTEEFKVRLTYVISDDLELYQVTVGSEVMERMKSVMDLGFEVKVEYLN